MSQPKTPAELNAEFVRIAADLGNSIAEAVVNAAASALQTERAAVVTYLRDVARVAEDAPLVAANFQSAAQRIERGEHRREEEP